ncbi:MAG: hypothetical protein U9N40_03850 [Euryarchaeota archaeon]|nr:hypothetical protein [Euryarchaeota archaeon]
MAESFIPDAVFSDKLEKNRKELFEYIDNNPNSVDQNFPVFFGQVASILDQANVHIPDQAHDELIDAVTYKFFEKSTRMGEQKFTNRVCKLAGSIKRNKKKMDGIHLAAAVNLMKNRKYLEAIVYLKPYRKYDAEVGCWYAYCYYALYKEGSDEPGFKASERWNYAKISQKAMAELSRWKPPLHRLVKGELAGKPFTDKPFWYIIFNAIEWEPTDRWFPKIGILKAKKDHNETVLAKLLQTTHVRFPNDMYFFREMYLRYFEEGELDGAIYLIDEMRERHPMEHEPIYYGIRTAFFLPGDETFKKFRAAAEVNQMPLHIIMILDFGYAYLKGKNKQAEICLEEFSKTFPTFSYFSELLQYIVIKDTNQSKQKKFVVFKAIDQFCIRTLPIKDK